MNAIAPKPTPSLSVIADRLAGHKLAPATVVIPPASSTSFGRDAILPIDTAAAHGRESGTLAAVADLAREMGVTL